MRLRDRWRARTDDARRTKGDPPPTVDQLLVTVRQQGEVIREQMAVIARLRTAVAERTEYVEQLALELAEAKAEPKPTLREERIGTLIPEYEAWKDETR